MSEKVIESVKEYTNLFFINLKVRTSNFKEHLRVVCNYYSDLSFLKLDGYLTLSYLFNNPFGISKRFLLQKGELDVYTYGETPLSTLEYIANECRLSFKDTVFELGCGRGRTCFWLRNFIGCSVVGIDFVPEFVHRAQAITEKFHIPQLQFRLENFLKTDFTGATVIYLYGTCLNSSEIHQLISRFSSLPRGTKIITVSYPLTDYISEPLFEVMKRFPAKFTWGTADVYLQIKR